MATFAVAPQTSGLPSHIRKGVPTVKKLRLTLASFFIGAVVMALPAIALASCPERLGTNQLGDGKMYSCYLTGEDENYCYYDCYPLS